MKVVIATPLYPPQVGGPAAYAKALEEAWTRGGVRVRVVAYGPLERVLPPGLRHLAYLFRLLPALLGASAVLALDTWSVGLPALVATALMRKRLVLRIGGDFLWESYVARMGEPVRLSDFYLAPRRLSLKEELMRTLTRRLVRRASAIAFNSAWQRDIWIRAYALAPEKTSVIENYIPAERTPSPAVRKVFISAGRNHLLKQSGLLASVFEKVRADNPDIELDMRALTPEAHLTRIRDCYAVIIASVSEVNSNTAIDAITFGKPFILPADSGGLSREVAILADTRDPGALEQAIRGLLDPIAYEAARARVLGFPYAHSWEAVAQEFLVLLS